MRFVRRSFVSTTTVAGLSVLGGRALVAQESGRPPHPDTSLVWYDAQAWGVEGKAWDDTARLYDRFPARAQSTVRDAVWNLSRHSAGMCARFRTDATEVWVDYSLTSPSLAMPHMPATGVSGVDLYATDGQGQLRWLSVTRPTAQHEKHRLITGLNGNSRDYCAYLPLYNGVDTLRFGVPASATFVPLAPRTEKPLVFYGTSITQGACASRPGMPHPAILGRRLNRPVVNLGFSGNGKMEAAVGALLCELDPCVYVIDCLPNMVAHEIDQRASKLVQQLRAARPRTPILLVEDRTYSNAAFIESRRQRHASSRAALRRAYEQLVSEGVTQLYYLPGSALLGEDHDDTTDGSHPSDLGFYRHADAMEPLLRKMIGSPAR